MEQYELLPGTWYKSLHYALKYFHTERLLLRTTGSAESAQGMIIIGERLDDKWLDLTKTEEGLLIEINGQRRGLYIVDRTRHFRRDRSLDGRSWSLVYERVIGDDVIGDVGRLFYASFGFPNSSAKYTGPDDPELPKVTRTMFRSANMEQYIEIVFEGKIPIVRTKRLMIKSFPRWYYWQIDKTITTK